MRRCLYLYQDSDPIMAYVRMKTKFNSPCSSCGDAIPEGRFVWWNPKHKQGIRCAACTPTERDYKTDELMAWIDSLPDEELAELMGEPDERSEEELARDILETKLDNARGNIERRYRLTDEEKSELNRAVAFMLCGVVAWDEDVEQDSGEAGSLR